MQVLNCTSFISSIKSHVEVVAWLTPLQEILLFSAETDCSTQARRMHLSTVTKEFFSSYFFPELIYLSNNINKQSHLEHMQECALRKQATTELSSLLCMC